MYDTHIFLDLEMNPISREYPEERELCRAEIIEFGAVKLDRDYQLVDRFRLLVQPQYSHEMNRHVERLTSIHASDLENAPVFEEALARFTQWIGEGKIRFYSWSMSDWWQLSDEGEMKLENGLPDVYYDSRWVDFQAVYTRLVGLSRRNPLSLKNALMAVDGSFDGSQHDAVDDAENSAKLLQLVKSGQFYERSRKIREYFGHREPEKPTGGNAFAVLLQHISEEADAD